MDLTSKSVGASVEVEASEASVGGWGERSERRGELPSEARLPPVGLASTATDCEYSIFETFDFSRQEFGYFGAKIQIKRFNIFLQ